jgi:hypothetical protein
MEERKRRERMRRDYMAGRSSSDHGRIEQS